MLVVLKEACVLYHCLCVSLWNRVVSMVMKMVSDLIQQLVVLAGACLFVLYFVVYVSVAALDVWFVARNVSLCSTALESDKSTRMQLRHVCSLAPTQHCNERRTTVQTALARSAHRVKPIFARQNLSHGNSSW